MKGILWSLAIIGALSLGGCGGGDDDDGPSASDSPYDAGPRAIGSPVNEELAGVGEGLFKSKTCTTCHGFGMHTSGPDLAGVTRRRSEMWLEQQILHPDVMSKQDPITRELYRKYAVHMPNLKVKPEEAKALIEYIKHKDREMLRSGVTH